MCNKFNKFDEYKSIEAHWVANNVNNNVATYFVSFGVEHIPKDIKEFIDHKNIKANIYRVQPYDPTISRYFCIEFINFMLYNKKFEDFTA